MHLVIFFFVVVFNDSVFIHKLHSKTKGSLKKA